MDLKFRTLKSNEVDCRIQSISEKGLILLLYKDARVDQKLLDEVVGPMNWKKRYERDNANCIVSIWDEDKKQWIDKEDTGTESFTEKEKGLASDSFKRACVNWGIGRELYSAPFIWISSNDCNIYQDKQGKLKCDDKFLVKEIEYSEDREINKLSIVNIKTKEVVYSTSKIVKSNSKQTNEVNLKHINLHKEFMDVLVKTDTDLQLILNTYKVTDSLSLSDTQLTQAIRQMSKKIEKKEIF